LNNLSPEIRNSGNINIFKRKIKILLEKVPFYFGWGDRKLNINYFVNYTGKHYQPEGASNHKDSLAQICCE
jgi:hypothetical protein